MITRFEEFLYDEILVMMMSQERTRAPSRQSISNSSTSSQKDKPPVSTFEEDDFGSPVPATFYDSDELDHQLDEVLEEVLDEEFDEESDEESDDSSEYLAKDKANEATSTPFVSADTSSSISAIT
jgi:hypothetical protein